MVSSEIRFWRRVALCEHATARIGDHYKSCAACCWPWQGACNAHGYGRTKYVLSEHAEAYAHRVAWGFACLAGGNPPRDREVAHACDNPPCCNPSHLWLATHLENMEDRDAKGRAGNVGRHGGARPRVLTWGKVAELRELAATRRYTCRQLGDQFGVSAQMVSAILCGRSWGRPSSH